MKGHEKSSDKLSPRVNALLIIDVQEKIIRAIYKKDSITKNIKKLIDAYQILEENIFLSEQNPSKLGATISELLPKNGFKKIEKMEFSLASIQEFLKEIKNKNIKATNAKIVWAKHPSRIHQKNMCICTLCNTPTPEGEI